MFHASNFVSQWRRQLLMKAINQHFCDATRTEWWWWLMGKLWFALGELLTCEKWTRVSVSHNDERNEIALLRDCWCKALQKGKLYAMRHEILKHEHPDIELTRSKFITHTFIYIQSEGESHFYTKVASTTCHSCSREWMHCALGNISNVKLGSRFWSWWLVSSVQLCVCVNVYTTNLLLLYSSHHLHCTNISLTFCFKWNFSSSNFTIFSSAVRKIFTNLRKLVMCFALSNVFFN